MKFQLLSRLSIVPLLLATLTSLCFAQGGFEIMVGKPLNDAVPPDFYLEGNAIPVEKNRAVRIKTPAGARVLLALIVTAGFASRIQQKYSGMLISEGKLLVCGKEVEVGSYGFGLRPTGVAGTQRAEFSLHNQAGDQMAVCAMKKDPQLRQPKPLQVIVQSPASARLYLGRYWLSLGP